jgi:hypothetical protein
LEIEIKPNKSFNQFLVEFENLSQKLYITGIEHYTEKIINDFFIVLICLLFFKCSLILAFFCFCYVLCFSRLNIPQYKFEKAITTTNYQLRHCKREFVFVWKNEKGETNLSLNKNRKR